MTTALERLLDEAGRCVAATPALSGFARWPERPPPGPRVPRTLPVTARAAVLCGTPLLNAIAAAANAAHWQQTYSEEEVGRAYLDAYGWVELLGPDGHFHAPDLRAFIGIWGPGLHYPAHAHPASEIYFVLQGSARFRIAGQPPNDAVTGDTVEVPGGLRHEMTMGPEGFVVFALWKGPCLARNAQLERT